MVLRTELICSSYSPTRPAATVAAMTVAAKAVTRNRTLCSRPAGRDLAIVSSLAVRVDEVALTAQCRDRGERVVAIDLAPQAMHQHLDHRCRAVVSDVPAVIEQLRLGHGTSDVAQ